MQTFLPHLAARVLNRPLLAMEGTVDTYLAVLAARIGLDEAALMMPEASRFAGRKVDGAGYRITDGGVAVIPIIGTLVNRGAYIGAESGLTSYEGLAEQFKKAKADSSVRAILLDMATPGGEAAGCFDLAAYIREVRKAKPVYAIANDMACSAGYALASQCERLFVSQTSIVGSIGVIYVHFDRSKAYEIEGVKPTIIKSGARKADGNPYGPLSKETRERFEAEISAMRDMFITQVVAGRPNLKPADVKAMEAGVFMGRDAVDAGLADAVATFDQALEQIGARALGQRSAPAGFTMPATAEQPKEAPTMSTPEPATATPPAAAPTLSADALRAEGATAERQRIAGILGLDEAKDRPALAQQIALTPSATADDARRLLAAAPAPAAAASPTTKLYEALAASGGSPKVRGESVGDVAAIDRERANIERQTAHIRNTMRPGSGA